ncbi:MAG: ferritin [Candidatus Coatesbacteria bacterium]|nr:ferritin [Candidatus Coatesbacteria bacterium]
MLSKKLLRAMNDQINKEIYSAYLYYSMEAYFHSMNLPGFANWMNVQALEELTHAMKFFNFINERRGRVLIDKAIDAPPTNWKTPKHVFEESFKHEQLVTASINNLVKIAKEENDYASDVFLNWFVTEQVEEESSFDGVLQKLAMVKDQPGGLFMLDKEMAARVFTPPAAE